MSVLIVGSTALDSIKTPYRENARLLGGSASHAAVAASFFAPVKLVGIVGEDFPKRYIHLYRRHGIDLEGLQMASGKTFHWAGEYEVNMNNRRHHVLDQVRRPKFIIADTMDLWLNIALDDLMRLLRRIDAFVLNDSEARQLAKEDNLIMAAKKIRRLGPKYVIVKKGEHGAFLSSPGGMFVSPAFPLNKVVDPTGAGDSFVGGLIGYLANTRGALETNLKRGMIYGSVIASFCCEGFGLTRTTRVTRSDIEQRAVQLEKMVRF